MPRAVDPIKIDGLRDFQAALRQMDGETQKQLRVVLNTAADIVVTDARRGFPTRTGRAKATVKASSGQREASVKLGSTKAPYAPWLDYGGRVGRNKSVSRPFVRQGRYLYPAYHAHKTEIRAVLERELVELAKRAGLTVEQGGE